jgi:hypothetical protein
MPEPKLKLLVELGICHPPREAAGSRMSIPLRDEGRTAMNDATKRAASGAFSQVFAHVLTVSALLVIAACVFYVR